MISASNVIETFLPSLNRLHPSLRCATRLILVVFMTWFGSWIRSEEIGHRIPETPKFELDIQPILTAKGCNSGPCHGKSRGQNGFELSLFGFNSDMDYDAIAKNGRGRRVTPSRPEASLLLVKALALEPHGGGIRLEAGDPDYRTLVRWIKNGMPRVDSGDPVLTSIRFEPGPRSMRPMESEQLRVIATYSTGAEHDVTRTTSFASSDPGIVSVDRHGMIRASEYPGEVSIMGRFMGNIATWNSAVVRNQMHEDQEYEHFSRSHWIDDIAFRKWKQLGIVPSIACDDTTFLKRLYLDAIGRLPNAKEVNEYLADSDADRDNRWIDRVLAQPEYADYWANQWADLLRPNPYRVGIKATYALDAWIRQSFRANQPHDAFVRDILTAQGSTWRNGATTVFRDRREPEEITTLVSQIFLGVRLECAKCHQHPFEVYSQADFYGMASYFARIGTKGVGLSPPISGSEEMFFVKENGETKHPVSGKRLPPKPLRGTSIEIPAGEDPRVQLAQWLVDPENPYFAAAAVNRLWASVIGMGIVDPVDDFRATNPPSNPELLAALSDYFRKVGYDNKQLLKAIFSSRLYRLSSIPNETNASDHRNFSRHRRKRLRAEVLVDAISDVTGVPNEFSEMPSGSRAIQLWSHRIASETLDTFGRPDANQDPPCERIEPTTLTQSLHMMNANRIQLAVSSDQGVCAQWAKSDLSPDSLVDQIYVRVFCRKPTEAETKTWLAEWSAAADKRRLIEDWVWSMLNSSEFLFVN